MFWGTDCTDLPSEIPATPISRDEHELAKFEIQKEMIRWSLNG